MTAVIETDGLTKRYRRVTALSDCTISVPEGTYVRARPPGPPPGTHARLGRALATWVRQARAAGLNDEAIESQQRLGSTSAKARICRERRGRGGLPVSSPLRVGLLRLRALAPLHPH